MAKRSVRAFWAGYGGLRGVFNGSTVLRRIGWLGAVCSRPRQEGLDRSTLECFSFVLGGMMARIDWLGDTETGFGKAVLGVTLNFGAFFTYCQGWKG